MKTKVALALGGGGARGFAHIGVLKVLRDENLPIDLIVGTSMGAIIGGAYALDQDTDSLEVRIKELIESKEIKQLESFLGSSEPEEKKVLIEKFLEVVKSIYLWNISRTKKCIVDYNSLAGITNTIVPKDKNFSDTKIAFACVAADLLSSERVILKDGNLLEAILASSSIPGVFPPIEKEKKILIDGGNVSPVPVIEAKKLGADFVIGVNVEGLRLRNDFKSGVDIILQADQIRAYHFGRMNLNQCDFLISPDVSDLSWADFSKAQYCIQKGSEVTREMAGALKQAIARSRFKNVLRKLCAFVKK